MFTGCNRVDVKSESEKKTAEAIATKLVEKYPIFVGFPREKFFSPDRNPNGKHNSAKRRSAQTEIPVWMDQIFKLNFVVNSDRMKDAE